MLVAAGILTANVMEIVKRWKLEGGLPPVPGEKVHTRTTTGFLKSPPDLQLEWTKEDYRGPRLSPPRRRHPPPAADDP